MEVITNPKQQHIELGKVTWFRDYDEALRQSKLKNKPVLLFFQEIPGCSTCVNYGREVLSHPLMVEAIENEFIPLAIYNNKPGKDAQILTKYNEPPWNNPVAYFIDDKGKEIVSKLANNYEPLSMYHKIIEVLTVTKNTIPEYINVLGDDLKMAYRFTKTTIYETPCFWSGETSMAQHPAVMSTQAGWINHNEVVKIHFDSRKVTQDKLDDYAKAQGFYTIKNHEKYSIDKDPQYYIKQSNFKFLPLSQAQRTKINYAIPYKKDPIQYLSPKQKIWYKTIVNGVKQNRVMYHLSIDDAWSFMDKLEV